MADLDLSATQEFKSKGSAPPGMVCDGDVCYFPEDGAPEFEEGADEDDGPPPLLGDVSSAPVKQKTDLPKPREFPLPGLLAKVTQLVDSDGKPVPAETVLGLPDKVVGLYFSAEWCPPCKQFSPTLAEYLKSNSSHMSVIYVGMDHSQDQFLRNLQGKPFFAIPFSDDATRKGLAAQLGVMSIPTLAILKPGSCTKISSAGRKAIVDHMQGGPTNPVNEWKEGKCSVEAAGGEMGMLGLFFKTLRPILPYILAYFVYTWFVKPMLGVAPGKEEKLVAKTVAKGFGVDVDDEDEDEDEFE